MAKAKKQVLTTEALLKQALVPESEHPYKVPGNWVWTRLCNVVLSSVEKFDDFASAYDIKYIGLEHLGKDSGIIGCGAANDVKSLKNIFSKGDVLYGKLRPYLNKHDVVGFGGICSTDIMVLKPSPVASIYLINYYLSTDNFVEYAITNSKGINLPRVPPSIVYSAAFPLPPLAEQRRIVARIESLFEKLDRAKELAQNALDSFETRKAAILHKAFTGELTAKWREQNGVGMEGWEKKPLSELAFIQTGLAKGKKNVSETIWMPYLRVANVQDGFLDLDEIKNIEVEVNNTTRYTLQNEDVLFTEGGDYDKLGRGTVWYGQIQNCLHQNHIFAVRPNRERLNSQFLAYLAGSRYGKNYFVSCSKQTTNLASINSTQLRAFPVPLPSLPEQQEIVRILDSLFEKEQRAHELCDVIDRIDLMKKAILARAFRGELGTNDPSEESAMELLKEALAQ